MGCKLNFPYIPQNILQILLKVQYSRLLPRFFFLTKFVVSNYFDKKF
jgi:hypothetical protein